MHATSILACHNLNPGNNLGKVVSFSAKIPLDHSRMEYYNKLITIFKYLLHQNFSSKKGESIERNSDIEIKCCKCGNEYTMDMMRIAPDGKNLMCRNCLERKPVQKQEAILTENKQKKQEPSFKEYLCKSCKYSFKRAKRLAISACPYCDSNSLMIKGSAARIIADASKMKGD